MTRTADDSRAPVPLDPANPSVRTVVATQTGLREGRPVMIPGVPGTRVRQAAAPRPFTTPVPVFDRQRTEHEWEGGGAPQYRGSSDGATDAPTTWLRRLGRLFGA